MSALGIVLLCVISVLVCNLIWIGFSNIDNGAKLYTMYLIVLIIVVTFVGIMSDVDNTPTEKDIINGDAHYEMSIHTHINDNDTTTYKLYRIKWNDTDTE